MSHTEEATPSAPQSAAPAEAATPPARKILGVKVGAHAAVVAARTKLAGPRPAIVPEQRQAYVAPPEEVKEMAYAPPASTPTSREEPLNSSPQLYMPTAAYIPNAPTGKTGKSKDVAFGTLSVSRVKGGPGSNITAMYPARQFAADCAARVSDGFKNAFTDPAQQKRFEYFVKEALGSKQIQMQYYRKFSRFPDIFPDMLAEAVQLQVMANIRANDAALDSHRFLLKQDRNGYILNPLIAHAVRNFAQECVEKVALPQPEGPPQRGGPDNKGQSGRF